MESEYDYVVFDTKTAGLHPENGQICKIIAVGVKDGLPQGLFLMPVAIGGPMFEAVGRVNGITDNMSKGAPAIGNALDALLDFIGEDAVSAGYNIASFNILFMQAVAAKSGRVFIYLYAIDTLETTKELWPDLSSRSMDSLRGTLRIERTDAHRALADCCDELTVLSAELSVIMQFYTRKMDCCRSEPLRIAGVITEEIGEQAAAVGGTGTAYSLEIQAPDGEQWRWSTIDAYPTLSMTVVVGEGLLSIEPYRVRRVTGVGDSFHDFLVEEISANTSMGRMRFLHKKLDYKGGRQGLPSHDGIMHLNVSINIVLWFAMIVNSRRRRGCDAEDHGRMVRIMKKNGNRLEGIGERIGAHLASLGEVLGITPDDSEIYGNWIVSKAPESEVSKEEIGVIEGMDVVEDVTTCFPHMEDGVPFCWDYQIESFFKDARSALRRAPGIRSSKLTTSRKVIDGTAFVEQRRIPLQLSEGAECGCCERPFRANSASGERAALATFEVVPAGTMLGFSILVTNPKDAETVREWLDYDALHGLFQWRNSGKGRSEWEEVVRDQPHNPHIQIRHCG